MYRKPAPAVHPKLRRFSAGFADELADALVVEERWRAAARNEYGGPVSHDQRFGMIDLDAISANQLDREGTKRPALLKCSQRTLKMFGGHGEHCTEFPALTQLCLPGRLANTVHAPNRVIDLSVESYRILGTDSEWRANRTHTQDRGRA